MSTSCFIQTICTLSVRPCTVQTKSYSCLSLLRALVISFCAPLFTSMSTLTPRPHLQHTPTPPSPDHIHGFVCPFLIHIASYPIQSDCFSNSVYVPTLSSSNIPTSLCQTVLGSHQIFLLSVIAQGSGRFVMCANCSSTHTLTLWSYLPHILTLQ